MMQQLVFLTVFLGLIAGRQPVQLKVPEDTVRVEILLDDNVVANLRSAPWRTLVDFGPTPLPHRLEARAYDASGESLGTTMQKINVATPPSDLRIVADDHVAKLIWADIDAQKPEKIEARLDGAPVDVKGLEIPLPRFTDERVHLLEVTMKTASRELEAQLVFGGLFEDVASAELTAVPVKTSGRAKVDELHCAARGKDVRCAGIDDLPAQVIMVRDPMPNEAATRLELRGARQGFNTLQGSPITLDGEDRVNFLWPVGRSGQGSTASMLFFPSRAYVQTDFRILLTRLSFPLTYSSLRYADAVAVAGLQVAQSQRPRAVVLIIGKALDDASRITPEGAREYLARLGVPLYIWSLVPKQNGTLWGPAVDISSPERLRSAAEKLRRDLSAQRMLWVEGDHLPEEVTVTGGGVEAIAKQR